MAMHTTKSPRRRRWAASLSAILVVCLAAGLYWFQPWRLWTNTVVQDALPVVAGVVGTSTPARVDSTESDDTSTRSRSAALPAPRATAGRVATPSASPPGTGRSERRTAAAPPLADKASPSTVTQSTSPTADPSTSTSPSTSSSSSAPPATPSRATILATGTLISHEHSTSGTARIVKLADGRRVLTLENLRTSDGPALHVWLTDAPVINGDDGWKVFDDGLYTDLGDLKGNIGNQVYPLPPDLDLSLYSSVSVWCERFSVSFGAAELEAA